VNHSDGQTAHATAHCCGTCLAEVDLPNFTPILSLGARVACHSDPRQHWPLWRNLSSHEYLRSLNISRIYYVSLLSDRTGVTALLTPERSPLLDKS